MSAAQRIRDRFLRDFPAAVADDGAAVFVGAGVSKAAGYPSWKELLRDIGDELQVRTDDIQDLAALAQWSVTDGGGSATRIRQLIHDQISPDRPIPEALKILARMPIKQVWTTNYDRLIERAFGEIGRPCEAVSAPKDLPIRPRPGATRLYKMHGSVERLDDVVISTDDYELFRSRRGAFLPLLQAHLTSYSMLFLGLSFTDPNLRHVLATIRESFTDAPPEHFALVRAPQLGDYTTDDEYKARLRQHELWARDLRRYGLLAVELDDFNEVPELMREVERRVARPRVWVSGSWPIAAATPPGPEFIDAVAKGVGRAIGQAGLTLVSGSGVLVSQGALSGFLGALQAEGHWDLERRLIVRPFPQPLGGALPDQAQWRLLREELARLSGTVIFIGGLTSGAAGEVDAAGVLAEREIAEGRGAYLLPIGATGGAAKTIAQTLIGSTLPADGPAPRRPTDDELRGLLDPALDAQQLIARTASILVRRLR